MNSEQSHGNGTDVFRAVESVVREEAGDAGSESEWCRSHNGADPVDARLSGPECRTECVPVLPGQRK